MLGIKLGLSDNRLKSIIGKVKRPLIMFDQVWLALFPRELKNDRMELYEKRIVELMKEDARLREEREILSGDKLKSMDYINRLTPAAFTENKHLGQAKREMRRLRVKMLRANSRLAYIERRRTDVDSLIDNANTALLEETVKICYNSMNESKKRIEELTPKAEALREELRSVLTEINQNETRFDKTFNLLNKLVGKEIVDEIDKSGGITEKKKWFWV